MLFNERLGRIAKRVVAATAAAGAFAALASCGGGTYQQKAFVPARLIVFGDESSRLEGPQGLKYSINAVSSDTKQIVCSQNPLWTQVVAAAYGLVFKNCDNNASPEFNAIDLTTVNATADDLTKSVDAFEAGDTFNGNDLVTIWVGMHDVLGEYQANGSGDEGTLKTDMNTQGAKVAAAVDRITAAGAKVLLLTIPDMSLTPYAYAESQKGDFDRLQVLHDMSTQFNLGLRTNIVNDGSRIGLVLVDDLVRNATLAPGAYGLIQNDNQTFGCPLALAPLPECTSDVASTTIDPSTGQAATAGFLWADPTHLGNVLQLQIGNQANGRAHSNPF